MELPVRSSIWFPLSSAGWTRKLLIGAVIGLFLEVVFLGFAYFVSEEAAFSIAPLAVLLNLPGVGYALRVYRSALTTRNEPLPEWGQWEGLILNGLVTIGITLVYCMVPILLLVLGLGLLVKGGVLLFLGMVLLVLGVLSGVFALFFLPMGLAHYVVRQRLEAAFHPGILWGGITRVLTEYVATYLVCIGLYILAALVSAIPYLGAVAWPFLGFYLLLVQAQLFGTICAKAA
jgi:hypothetical protein